MAKAWTLFEKGGSCGLKVGWLLKRKTMILLCFAEALRI